MGNNFYNSLCILILIACLASCTYTSQTDVASIAPAEPTLQYTIATATPLDRVERDRIFYACSQYYDTALLPSGFNGGILVAKGGQVIFEKYRGYQNLDSQVAIQANTPMHIASVSKTFTAMAILKMHEQGLLNINDSVGKYLTSFNYDKVTIKTLLTHRSGLPNYLHFLKEVGWADSLSMKNEDLLQLLVQKKMLFTTLLPADTKFAYNNTNYALLALIIEKVSGINYAAFMQKNIFTPIGMKNTFVRYNMDTTKLTNSFDWKGRKIHNNNLDEIYGDKNIYSTPEDLLKWDRVLADSVFLKPATKALAYLPYSNEKPGIKNYGLGWRMDIYPDGKKIVFHNGWWHGNNAVFIRLIKDDVTIIVLSNRFARQVYGSKILVNIFGNYYTEKNDEEEAIIPANIPEKYTEEQKWKSKNEGKLRFRDMNRPESKGE